MAKIYIYDNVLDILIKHTKKNPNYECGGFLFGTFDKYQAHINGIYYEPIIGEQAKFVFCLSYRLRALQYLKKTQNDNSNIKLLGTYHSHGIYDSIFSDQDRNLEKNFKNGVTLIYSPKHNKLVGDIVTNNYIISSPIDVIDINKKKVKNIFNPNITYSECAICIDDNMNLHKKR